MIPKTVHILLADDNPALRSALALLLETRLHARIIGESFSMEGVLASVVHTRPDLVILDWELPGMPETNRVSALRRIHPTLKVVVTSSRPDVARFALTAHADAFVCKSEPPERIVHVIEQI